MKIHDSVRTTGNPLPKATAQSEPTSFQWRLVHRFPEPTLERAWRDALSDVDYPTHYVAPEFFHEPLVERSRPFAVLALDGEKVVGVVCGIHEGRRLVSGLPVRPQTCCRLGHDPTSVAAALARGLREESKHADLVTIYTWRPLDGFIAAGYRVRSEEGVLVVDLGKGPDALFKEFSQNRRTNIRKAIKLGVTVRQADTEADYRAFYQIYLDWCRRKQVPAMTTDVMERTFALRQSRRVFLAEADRRIVAGVVVRFCPNGFLEYAANSSIDADQHFRPNDLLHWRVIEWACREHFSHCSLGGTHLFLRQFGGAIWSTYRYSADHSWLRHHTAREFVTTAGRRVFHLLPQPAQATTRRLLGRSSGRG